ncbi:hypothetical protein AB3N59_05985 [Leptospira sp. WS92.C1]
MQKTFGLGANGYLLKRESTRTIFSSVKIVLSGENLFPEEVKNFRPETEVTRELGIIINRLTKREREILNRYWRMVK